MCVHRSIARWSRYLSEVLVFTSHSVVVSAFKMWSVAVINPGAPVSAGKKIIGVAGNGNGASKLVWSIYNKSKMKIATVEPVNRERPNLDAGWLKSSTRGVPYLSEGLLGRIQIGPGRRVGHGRPPHALMVGRDGVCRACHGLADGVTTFTLPTSCYSRNRLWSAVRHTHVTPYRGNENSGTK